MFTRLLNFWLDQDGQDITEYTLLLAFVALVSAALFLYNGTSVSKIWCSADSFLSQGSS
jgi:Flp pilus assembly pilin Flp